LVNKKNQERIFSSLVQIEQEVLEEEVEEILGIIRIGILIEVRKRS